VTRVMLGRTGLAGSRLGLGFAALGRPAYITLGHGNDLAGCDTEAALEQRAHAVLDAAWDAGVRVFDVARSYGEAEKFLQTWLASRRVPPGSVTVSSKWGYTYVGGWRLDAAQHEIKDHSLAALRRQAAETRARLGSHVGLYQIHSVTPDSPVLGDAGVLEELAHLREEGWKIGLTTSGPRQAEIVGRALETNGDGTPLFDTVQVTWNLLEPSSGPALAAAHARGIGVIVKETLANGRLAPRPEASAANSGWGVLERIGVRRGATPDAVALSAVLAQPWADVVLLGPTRVDHLRSNITALDVQLEPEDWEALRRLAEPPSEYWATRARLAWN